MTRSLLISREGNISAMADDGFKLQISYKFGPSNGDMLNVRANDPHELDLFLENLNIPLILETGQHLRAAGLVQAAIPATTSGQAVTPASYGTQSYNPVPAAPDWASRATDPAVQAYLAHSAEYQAQTAAAQAALGTTPAPAPVVPGGGAQHPGAKACEHGVYIYKSGTSKAGNAYKLWSCPAPGKTNCPAEFIH